jgi:hypothetical protein
MSPLRDPWAFTVEPYTTAVLRSRISYWSVTSLTEGGNLLARISPISARIVDQKSKVRARLSLTLRIVGTWRELAPICNEIRMVGKGRCSWLQRWKNISIDFLP